MPTSPTAIPDLATDPPLLTQDTATFNTNAEAIYTWLVDDFTPGANALASNVYANALEAEDDAITAQEASAAAVGAANYQGDYSAGTTYTLGQSVSYSGARYIAKKTNLGITPVDGADWLKIPFFQPQPGVYQVRRVYQSSSSLVIPEGISTIRAYVGGAGGNGHNVAPAGGGGGGGFAFGSVAVTQGETLTITIAAGVAQLLRGATVLLQGNPGANATTGTGGAGGTAIKHASVTDGAAYTGGTGGTATSNGYAGGGSAGSPLGNGFSGGGSNVNTISGGGGGIGGVGAGPGSSGGGGAGGAGQNQGGGGAGGPASDFSVGAGRVIPFADPLLAPLTAPGGEAGSGTRAGNAGPGGGGGGRVGGGGPGGDGGFGGGGGGGTDYGGRGGELGGGGAGQSGGSTSLACGGGGSGGTGGAGGPATVWIFY
jgi:hypothetical protein